jgi:hypothetical protein
LSLQYVYFHPVDIISIDEKLKCPIQFQGLLAYSKMKLKERVTEDLLAAGCSE